MKIVGCLALLVLAAVASAGHYVLAPNSRPGGPNDVSGGVVTDPAGNRPYYQYYGGTHYDPSTPYEADTCDYLGQGVGAVGSYNGSSFPAAANVTCQGEQRWVFNWVHTDPNHPELDPAPGQMLVKKYVLSYIDIGSDPYTRIQASGFTTGLGEGNEALFSDNTGNYITVGAEATAYETVIAGDTVTVTLAPYAYIGIERSSPPAGTYDPYGGNWCHAYCETQVTLQSYTPLDASVSVTSAKVKGLSFNTANHQHQADFTVKATALQANGQAIPAGASMSYTWSTPAGDPLRFAGKTAITTATATGPSLCYPQCTVVATFGGQTYAGTGPAECAAIGGPITTSPLNSASPNSRTYAHDDNDGTKPFYLTYYNKSPFAWDKTDQIPQGAIVAVQGNQPRNGTHETQVNFEPIPGVDMSEPDPALRLKQAKVLYALGAFQGEKPKAHFVFNDGFISNDGTLPGQPALNIVDDSDETKDKVHDSQTQTESWVSHVYAISGHVPLYLEDAQDPGEGTIPTAKPQGATYWTNQQAYRYVLYDSVRKRMPGVWIQERFTDQNPLNLTVNQTGQYWFTRDASIPGSGTISTSDGLFDAFGPREYDVLWYYGWAPNDNSIKTTMHAYFAGTNDATWNATTGIPLGTCTITFAPGTTTLAGTASQTPPPSPPSP